MAMNKYVGMRYVPKVLGNWDITKLTSYEALVIVTYQGNSYTSKKIVPSGIDISDDNYWVLTGNYNAQVELYRIQVDGVEDRMSTLEEEMDTFETTVIDEVAQTNTSVQYVKNLDYSGIKAVVYGDSTATSTGEDGKGYYTKLAEKTGLEITNRAISGTTLIPINSDCGYNLINASTDLANFDYIFLSFGTNEWQGNVDTGHELNNNVFDFCYSSVIDIILTKNPKIKIVVVLPFYSYHVFSGNINYNGLGLTLLDYNDSVRKILRNKPVIIVDLYNLAGVNINNYSALLRDDSGGIFVHANQYLCDRISDILMRDINQESLITPKNTNSNLVSKSSIPYGNWATSLPNTRYYNMGGVSAQINSNTTMLLNDKIAVSLEQDLNVSFYAGCDSGATGTYQIRIGGVIYFTTSSYNCNIKFKIPKGSFNGNDILDFTILNNLSLLLKITNLKVWFGDIEPSKGNSGLWDNNYQLTLAGGLSPRSVNYNPSFRLYGDEIQFVDCQFSVSSTFGLGATLISFPSKIRPKNEIYIPCVIYDHAVGFKNGFVYLGSDRIIHAGTPLASGDILLLPNNRIYYTGNFIASERYTLQP